VLDNCERVIEAAAALAERVLQAAPGVHLLATSREPLRAESEYVHRLAPLGTPPDTHTLTRAEALSYPAIQLFIERASAYMDSFELHEGDISLLAQICSRLEGNPLAIDLAAARVDLFGIRGLAAGLTDSLRLLSRGRRTAVPRHQSLRATLDWSYELLSPLETAVLRRLAMFSGPFDTDSASIVAEDSQIRATDVFDTLTNLVAKSLLLTQVIGERTLYRLPETTRTYAFEKLHESGEVERILLLHAETRPVLVTQPEPHPPTPPPPLLTVSYKSA
jgi:predicted ATPase